MAVWYLDEALEAEGLNEVPMVIFAGYLNI